MPITAVLQKVTPYSLIYRIDAYAPGTVVIKSSGGASPDLATDVAGVTGPIKKVGRAGLDGIGLIPPGGFDTVVKSDALLQSLDPINILGDDTVPRAIMICQGKHIDNAWVVSTAVENGLPQVTITHPTAKSDRTGILMIMIPYLLS